MLLSTLISGSALVGFGLYFLSVINKVSIDRIDREILALGESQLHVWHPKRHWQDFGNSLRFIYGQDRWKDLAVQVTDAKNQVLYQSPHWPEEISEASFPEFDFKMETGPGRKTMQEQGPWDFRPGRPSENPAELNGGSNGSFEKNRPHLRPPPRAGQNEHNRPPPPPPPARDGQHRSPRPVHIKKPFFQTVETTADTWRAGIMGNQHITILLGMDMAGFYQDAARFQKAFLFTVPMALLLLAGGGWLIAHRAMKPVDLITRTAEGITARGLDQRIPPSGADSELLRLINVINGMLDRLEKSFGQAVRFSADAAHELQTPLTILQGVLDDSVQHAPSASDEQRRYSDLLEEVQRLKAIVQKLLILARADAGQLALALEPVDMSGMIEAVIEDAGVVAPHLRIEQQILSGVMVQADPELLRQVIQNLTANAVKYNLDEGLIRFRLTIQADNALFSLSNTGIPIAEKDRKRLFDRFYRVDKSRSNRVPGTGLGLSLAREIARAHKGELRFDNVSDNLITFILSLPLNPDSTLH